MKQHEIINQIKDILFANANIETAFLYGSFARKNPSVNSDIDIATVVNCNFNVDALLTEMEKNTLTTLSISSPPASASALYDLSHSYKDFASELEKLPRPTEEKEAFEKTIISLTTPLKKKMEDAESDTNVSKPGFLKRNFNRKAI